ncbi:MAG: DUF5702 domain-containing protein [Gallintestinimicrobium sp.]
MRQLRAGERKQRARLRVEYILQQQTQDRENLKKTLQEILLLREAVNAAFLFGSSLKRRRKPQRALLPYCLVA